jgi:ABC-2 type transport system permease protein
MTTIAMVELRLLIRKKVTAFSVLLVPVGLVALTAFGVRPGDGVEWGALAGRNWLLVLLVSVFLVQVTVFTARRQSLVLKRLRTSGLSDTSVLAGVLAPMAVVALAEAVFLFGCYLALGAPAPSSPALVAVGVVLGLLVAMAAGVATASLSRSVEATQITAMPVMVASMAGLFLAATTSPVAAAIGVAMPMAGPADLVARGWSGAAAGASAGEIPVVAVDLASTAVWLVLAAVVVARGFRWEPRA